MKNRNIDLRYDSPPKDRLEEEQNELRISTKNMAFMPVHRNTFLTSGHSGSGNQRFEMVTTIHK